ncbi:DNA-methyltransferase [Pseudodesulfovibrio methanolicus]|uniref:site-specific DNA-methyltransferase (adenine-specific) n=1 Tax=Pseudodesulfovibrio methanolicus TaxID=3126690 RepID=A0ABZ2IXN3_9BACT
MSETKVTIYGQGPWEDDEYGRRYQADAYVLLECLDPHCVDAVITDPPYEINIRNQAWDRRDIHIDWLAYQFARVTKPKGYVLVFGSDLQFGTWYRELGKYFTQLRKFAWPKTNPDGLKKGNLGDFAEAFELAIHASNEGSWFRKGRKGKLNYKVTGVPQGRHRAMYETKTGETKALHPTQKHLEVLHYLIDAFTRKGDTILDPFAGIHTTAIAASHMGRRYITNDITPYYKWADPGSILQGWLDNRKE